ncbi:MAG: hypothetical protein LBF64_05105 [Oscillospiraceae bacterium]|jgi:hypothetical protein|nr:hypothetical protein [Oscillospiraceae bacterium]
METKNQGGASAFMLKEPVRKLLPKFAIPCVVSLIISCLYNIVDQIFVGQGIGYLGNAATGIIFPITVVGWGISLLFGDGGAAFLSISQGAGDTKVAGKSVANSVIFSFLTGAALILVCYLAGNGLLYALGATDATIALTREYGSVIFAMMPIALAGQTLVTIIRADGSPKYAMFTMLVGGARGGHIGDGDKCRCNRCGMEEAWRKLKHASARTAGATDGKKRRNPLCLNGPRRFLPPNSGRRRAWRRRHKFFPSIFRPRLV